jgi:ABC-2 type transport system permease protein
MSAFTMLMHLQLKRTTRYPWGFAASLIAGPIVLLMNVMLLTSIYEYNQTQTILNYELPEMIWYFASSAMMWYWIHNIVDARISSRVLSGEFAQDLLRPMSLITWELGYAISMRLTALMFEWVPCFVLYSLFFPPGFLTVASFTRFLIVAILAFLTFFSFNFLLGVAALRLKNTLAMRSVKHIVIGMLAGAFFPLDFFPDGMIRVLNWTPFPHLFYWPAQFFLNRAEASSWSDLLQNLVTGIGWLAVLLGTGLLLWRRTVRHYVDAGG